MRIYNLFVCVELADQGAGDGMHWGYDQEITALRVVLKVYGLGVKTGVVCSEKSIF